MTWILFWMAIAGAAEKSAFEQALENNQDVETKERWTVVDGIQYREVEYQGERFYVNFKRRDGKSAELNCGLTRDSNRPHLTEVGFKITRRTRAFVQLLKESCVSSNGHDRVVLTLDPRIGFTLPEDSNSVIKNKKVYLAPTGLGFSGDW